MPKNTTQCPQPGLEPRPLDLGMSTLTMRPPCLPSRFITAGLDISAHPLAQASGKTVWRVQITDHSPSLASMIFISRILLKISATFYIQFKIIYTVHKAIACSLLFETSHKPGFKFINTQKWPLLCDRLREAHTCIPVIPLENTPSRP